MEKMTETPTFTDAEHEAMTNPISDLAIKVVEAVVDGVNGKDFSDKEVIGIAMNSVLLGTAIITNRCYNLNNDEVIKEVVNDITENIEQKLKAIQIVVGEDGEAEIGI